MAKNTNSVAVETTPAAFAITTHNDGEKFHPSELPGKSIEYLLQYGMSKSLQDAASGCIKSMTDLATKAEAGTLTDAESKVFSAATMEVPNSSWATPAEFAEAVAKARKDVRLEKILAGTMDVGTTGPRLKGIDAVIRDVAIEALRVAYSKNKIAWPTDTKVVATQVARYLERNGDKARAEAQRRMDAQAEVVADDMDFILAA